MSGYLKIDRKIQDWKYKQEPLAFALWIHLLMIAGWDDNGDFKKGELITSVSSLSEETGISRPIIRKWLKAFQDEEQIQMEKNGNFYRITIVNYERYNWQKITNPEDTSWQKNTNEVVKNDQPVGKKLPTGWQKITNPEESHPYLNKNTKRNKRSKTLSINRESVPPTPTLEEVKEFCQQNDLIVDPEEFWLFYDGKGWKVGSSVMQNWKSTIRSWNLRRKKERDEQDPEEKFKQERKKRGGLPFA